MFTSRCGCLRWVGGGFMGLSCGFWPSSLDFGWRQGSQNAGVFLEIGSD
jgi:hypothetical protein